MSGIVWSTIHKTYDEATVHQVDDSQHEAEDVDRGESGVLDVLGLLVVDEVKVPVD